MVPPEVDLRDFAFMPLEVRRVLDSDTWTGGTGDQRAASLALWIQSWHQVPAGSLPSSEVSLAQLSHAGAAWKRVRAHALRGWEECSDGRLYHRVVSAKALEAWLEKLHGRRRGGAGNAARWRGAFDSASIDQQIADTRVRLAVLDPGSRALHKDPKGNPSRNPQRIPEGFHEGIQQGLPNGSSEDSSEDRNKTVDTKSKSPPYSPPEGDAPGDEPQKPAKASRRAALTFRGYAERCSEASEPMIADDDPVFAYAERINLPREFVGLAWWVFSAKHAATDRKQASWPQHFRNAVAGNWGNLWLVTSDGEYRLTTAGRQAEADMAASMAEGPT